MEMASIVVGFGKVGIEANGLGEVGLGLRQVVLLEMGNTSVVVGFGAGGNGSDRMIQIGNGLLRSVAAQVGEPSPKIGLSESRMLLDSRRKVFDSLFKFMGV